jgi:hypothetical protein
MIDLLLFVVAALSFSALMHGQPRHQGPLLHRMLPPQTSRGLRVAGWAGLALGYALAVVALGWGYGTITALGAGTLGALAAVLHLAFRTQSRRHVR